MSKENFKALIVEEFEEKKFRRYIGEKSVDNLPNGDVLIEVHYSSLNYKDALSARGHKGITRNYPHTPGIDASGQIIEKKTDKFRIGQKVFVTGFDLGMNTSGGFGQYIRVPSDWVIPLPDSMSMKEVMIYGTAGFTAGICIDELIKHGLVPDTGKILVTGATGGVGSLAVAMLSKLGYKVSASSGKMKITDMLIRIGASEIIAREELFNDSGRPLLKGRWAGVVECVGGKTLETVIKSVQPHGTICCLGNVSGDTFSSTVYPFILRGINLLGIDSAERPLEQRLQVWNKIFKEWKIPNFEKFVKEITLDELSEEINKMLNGEQTGKVIVNLQA